MINAYALMIMIMIMINGHTVMKQPSSRRPARGWAADEDNQRLRVNLSWRIIFKPAHTVKIP